MGTALDPDGLLAASREVYWWAAFRRGATVEQQQDAEVRGARPSGFRSALLDAWAAASTWEHTRLRLGFPEYAGPILMWKVEGVPGVAAFLDALEADVIDIRTARG